MGRRSKLTPEARERFLTALRGGSFPEVAAKYAGFSAASLYRYLASESPEHDGFRDEVVRVQTELELRLAGTVVKAAFSSPRWAVTFLEKRFSERWGRHARTETQPEATEPAPVGPRDDELVVLDRDQIDLLVSKLLDAAARLRTEETAAGDTVDRFEERGGDADSRADDEEPT